MTDTSAKILQAGLAEKAGSQSEKMSKKSTNDSSTKRVGKRGRRPSKVDVKVKLERSRQSARECRARKKLRYQYLEELVNSREKAVYALRSELEQYRQVCESIDNGHIPEGIEKLLTPSNPNRKPQKPVVKAESDSEETPYDILMDVLGEPGTSQQAGEGSQSSPDGSYGWSPSTNNPKEMSRSSSSSDSTQSSSHSPITPNQEDPRTTSFLNILESILRAPSSSASDSVNTSDMGGHALDELGAIASPSVSFQACSPSVFHHVVHDYGQIPKYPVSSSSQTSYSGNDGMDVGSGFEGDMNVETSVSQIAFVSTDGLQAFPDTTAVSAPTVCDTNGMSYTTPSASSSPAEPFWYKVNVSAVGQVTGDAQHDAALLNRFRTTSSWFPSAVHDQPTNQITPNTPSPEDIQEILSSTP